MRRLTSWSRQTGQPAPEVELSEPDLARLRAQGVATPMLVLSARGTTQDRVDGLDAGLEPTYRVSELADAVNQVRNPWDRLGACHAPSSPPTRASASHVVHKDTSCVTDSNCDTNASW